MSPDEIQDRLPSGRRMALDFGLSRIGVAISDPLGDFSFPVTVVDQDLWESQLPQIIAEYEPEIIYLGYPIKMAGSEGSSASLAREFGKELSQYFAGPIHLVDERLTTKSAESLLRESGINSKASRSRIDAEAANLILDFALAIEKSSAQRAGSSLI
jgi:putative holliday junction resolvase